MDTRSHLPNAVASGKKLCVYCDKDATTQDHTPPRCLLKRPLPSNLLTLPACQKCNTGFSFDEEVVRSILTLVSSHPDLIAERQGSGRLSRALARNERLRNVIGQSYRDGKYHFTSEIFTSFERVLRKTVQGLYFGYYNKIVENDQLAILRIDNHSATTPMELAEEFRPSPLVDITDQPLPDITPNSWPVREPIFFMKVIGPDGIPGERCFRLKRETPIEWRDIQAGIFTYAFVQNEKGKAICVIGLWETLVIAISAPWPDNRGPVRKGRKNPLSRE